MDTDDNGRLNIGDGISVLNYLFANGDSPADPGPNDCGLDTSDDALTCETYGPCQ